MSKNVPTDQELYAKVKRRAKRTFEVWPSAYASGWLVQEYKREFEKKHGKRKSPYKVVSKNGSKKSQSGGGTRKRAPSGLNRWFKEDWRNVCERDSKGNYKPCGRTQATTKATDYPYCRPLHRVTNDTPKTIKEMSKSELRGMCRQKRRSMRRRSPRRKSPTRVYVKKNRD
jgi:hypothetical protein